MKHLSCCGLILPSCWPAAGDVKPETILYHTTNGKVIGPRSFRCKGTGLKRQLSPATFPMPRDTGHFVFPDQGPKTDLNACGIPTEQF